MVFQCFVEIKTDLSHHTYTNATSKPGLLFLSTPAYSKSHTITQYTARFASCSSLNAQSPSPSLQEKQHTNRKK